MDPRYNHSSCSVKSYGSLPGLNCGYILDGMETSTYGQRLRLVREKAGLTQKELAEAINNLCTQENISKLERSKTAQGSAFTASFAKACNINPLWLETGKGPMLTVGARENPIGNITESRDVGVWYPGEEPVPDGHVAIEAVSLEVGAGSRLVVSEHPEHRLRVYDADFFIRHRCSPGQCRAYRVSGDSMRPFIFDRDWVVVDTNNRTPPGPGVTDERLCTYVLRLGDEIMVKMLHRLPDGSLRVSSVNPEPRYAPFTVPAQNMDTVEIWGAYLERSGGRPVR